MEDSSTKKGGLLSAVLGDVQVNTSVGVSQKSTIDIAVILFIAAVAIILAYFSLRKIFM